MTTTLGAPERLSDPVEPPGPPDTPGRRRPTRLFAGVWRWHFYASFLVVPVLALLAVTGLIYLFRFQLEPALHPDLLHVDPRPGVTAAAFDDQREVVEEALDADGLTGAYIASMTEPRDTESPTRITVTLPDESSRDYFVDPYRLDVLGSLDPDATLSGTAVRLHANLMTGWVGDAVIELGACWAVVMSLTGYYLFVRGWRARRRAARQARTDARVRQTHAVVGAVAGVALLGLIVSGLPWTGVWGAKVQELATTQGTSLWSDDHGGASQPTTTMDESLPHSHAGDVPWGLGQTTRPTSDVGDYTGTVANLDTAALVADEAGLAHPYTTLLPTTPDGTFAVIGYAFDDPGQERTVHVDRYTGAVAGTYGYADYSGVAKVVSQGIALHEGRRLGPVNMALSAAMCVGILFLCVSGPVMWWRRRPKGAGRIGAPRGRMPLAATPALVAGLVVLGVLLPLFGASLVLVVLLDQLVFRRSPLLTRWLDVR
ncbi:PepSY-associated TM helix domain-containing protein [Microlunatus antarcticus]|uniref:Putative iron-regulated membrane protein n=1 Tax=Microlunatus antarcticus TaxID=53388 RepID=A0A7W5JV55_9ACTN|nr:PepSY domain-containing protein [Microlunatus antarcticus]MBB3326881.1 putative iron-regulated membrane protein [Microlunatus antarcticus]